MKTREEQGFLEQMDIMCLVRDVCRQWWVILLLSLSVSLLTNVWVTKTYQPEYTVTSTFVVTAKGMNSNVYQNLTSTQELAKRFSQVLGSNVLKRKVAETLGVKELHAKTSVNVLPETNLIELQVTAEGAMEAYHVMHGILKNYNAVSDYVVENVILEMIQPPLIPDAPSNPLDSKEVMKKSFLLSVLVLILLFAGLSYLKDTVKNEKEVEEKIDAKLLGSICHERKSKFFRQKNKKKISMLIHNPLLSFRFVENNKLAASKIRSCADRKKAKVLLVTSVLDNEGKSTVAANLALSLTEENKKVLLIDFDFQKPAQYKIFDQSPEETPSFSEILQMENLVKQHSTGLYTLFNKESERMETALANGMIKRIIEFFRQKMEYIIIDTSPVALVADVEELAQLTDGTILVIKQDKVVARAINDVIDVFNKTNSKVLGCVFNDVLGGPTEQYGYRTHYGYGGYYGKRAK